MRTLAQLGEFMCIRKVVMHAMCAAVKDKWNTIKKYVRTCTYQQSEKKT